MAFETRTKWPTDNFPEFILHHLPVGLFTVDANRKITYFNPAAVQITGYTREEVLSKFCGEVLKGGQCKLSCPLRTVLTMQQDSVTLETTIQVKDGRVVPVQTRAAAMFDQNGLMIGALEAFSDISELKNYEQERSRTLSIFAHDMKTPLISISGFINRLLEGKVGGLNEQQRKYLEVVRDEANQIQALAMDFLDVARLGREGAALIWEDVNLREIVQSVVLEYSQKAEAGGMVLTTEIEPNLPTIKGDAHRLRRAITNLLNNALKYSERGKVHLIISLEDMGYLKIKVTDQGPGLSPRDLESIFDPFYRGSAAQGKEGTGLGLTAVKKIAEAHYGGVSAGNRKEGGAEFTLTLPLQNR